MKTVSIVIQSTSEIINSVANSLNLHEVAQDNAKRFYFQYREFDHDLRAKFSKATTDQFGVDPMNVETHDNDIQLIFKFEVDDEDYNDFIADNTENGVLSIDDLKVDLIDNDILSDYAVSFSSRTIIRINNAIVNAAANNDMVDDNQDLAPQVNNNNEENAPEIDADLDGDVPEHPIRRVRRGRNLQINGNELPDEVPELRNEEAPVVPANLAQERSNISGEELENVWTLAELVNLYLQHNISLNEVAVTFDVPNLNNFRCNGITISFH